MRHLYARWMFLHLYRFYWGTRSVDLARACEFLSAAIVRLSSRLLDSDHRWNGFGGKVEPQETPAQAAVRELQVGCAQLPVAVGSHPSTGRSRYRRSPQTLRGAILRARGSRRGVPYRPLRCQRIYRHYYRVSAALHAPLNTSMIFTIGRTRCGPNGIPADKNH